MINVIYAPSPTHNAYYSPKLFLAGSIEMGLAEKWQDKVVDLLEYHQSIDRESVIRGRSRLVNVLNPRRPDWDSSWDTKFENAQFSQQVNWELDAINFADAILFYFDPNTKSPISLMELGLVAASKKSLRVVCPEGFWKKGNVDIICNRYHIRTFQTLEEAVEDYVKLSL